MYTNTPLPAPKLSKSLLENLLMTCTTEAPFRSPDNKLYYQVEGVMMGSPLGPTFADFYMCDLENKVLQDQNIRPTTYCRYVDDIYVVVRDEDHLNELKNELQRASVVQFTTELSANNKLAFLDIEVEVRNGRYQTTVHRKPTDLGKCLNPVSECPDTYKTSVVRSYVQRAYKVCSSPELLQAELSRSKQILVNNGYTNTMVDREIRKHQRRLTQPRNPATDIVHTVYYCNQMSRAYKEDERALRGIIKRNVRCREPDHRLNLVIYYKNRKVRNLIMDNNPTRKRSALQQVNVLYEFKCPQEGCKLLPNVRYVGFTRTTLSRRLTMHLGSGAPKDHMNNEHGIHLTREQIVENTAIIKRFYDPVRLEVAEALLIKEQNPAINAQHTGATRRLLLYGS